jgi:hypothetical protein
VKALRELFLKKNVFLCPLSKSGLDYPYPTPPPHTHTSAPPSLPLLTTQLRHSWGNLVSADFRKNMLPEISQQIRIKTPETFGFRLNLPPPHPLFGNVQKVVFFRKTSLTRN